jgi:hypothetical protein
VGTEGVEAVISKGHMARVVRIACMSRKGKVMVPVIGIAAGTMSQEEVRASMGMAAEVKAVR